MDVGRPLELGGICVTGTDEAGLELLELLLGTELVGLEESESVRVGIFGQDDLHERERSPLGMDGHLPWFVLYLTR